MRDFLKSLRRGRGDHREVFAEFAMVLDVPTRRAARDAERRREAEGGEMSSRRDQSQDSPSPDLRASAKATLSRKGRGRGAAAFKLSPSLALPRKGGGDALHRETKFAAAEISEVEADGSFSGYASLFGETDLNRDVVMPGAFLKSIGEARRDAASACSFSTIRRRRSGCGATIREDARGLFVSGRLMSEVAKGREVLALMRAGAIDGLSIGFRTVQRPHRCEERRPASDRGRPLGDLGGDLSDAAGGEGERGERGKAGRAGGDDPRSGADDAAAVTQRNLPSRGRTRSGRRSACFEAPFRPHPEVRAKRASKGRNEAPQHEGCL